MVIISEIRIEDYTLIP